MSIIVTPGETTVIDAFNKAGIEITIEDLKVGDIHIRKDGQTVYIFERKAKTDLDASIKDGRYREQKSRLLETGVPLRNIVYLIEQLTKPKGPVAIKRVWSSMCNSYHRDGFAVFQTKNPAETVEYIIGILRAVEKFDGKEQPVDDKQVNVNIKKRQVAQNDWFTYSLTLIPKCSLNIAKIITAKFPTIRTLLDEINNSGVECLSELKHGASQRRLGKKLSVTICDTIVNNY
jgi:ERCC4-type nuclease